MKDHRRSDLGALYWGGSALICLGGGIAIFVHGQYAFGFGLFLCGMWMGARAWKNARLGNY